ncbi:adenosine receptor A3-like [Clytia hemisphaerica]|uniref:adenosine receptor A3-like n=1 Tax=Clytia hemisphaerica TaxID=252671 RepID=UPI0034D5094C
MSLVSAPCSHVWAPTELSYFTTGVAGILCIITILGNVLVCLAVYKDPFKKLRTPFMFILVNLAVTDLIVGCVTLPIIVATHALEAVGEKKNIHVIIARITYFTSKTASILNLTAFCVDRYGAINWAIKYRRLLNRRFCLLVFSMIWLLSIGISLLYYAVGFIDFMITFASISLILVMVIFIVTFRLLKTLGEYSRERKSITDPKQSHRKSDRRVTKLFLSILIMFFACYTPAIIMMYIIKFCTYCDCTGRHVIRDLQFLFIIANSAVNPFLCTIRLKPFRHALANVFNIKMQMNPNDSPLTTPNLSVIKRMSRRLSSLFETNDEDDPNKLLKSGNASPCLRKGSNGETIVSLYNRRLSDNQGQLLIPMTRKQCESNGTGGHYLTPHPE